MREAVVEVGLADEQKGGLDPPLGGPGQTTHRTKAPSSPCRAIRVLELVIC